MTENRQPTDAEQFEAGLDALADRRDGHRFPLADYLPSDLEPYDGPTWTIIEIDREDGSETRRLVPQPKFRSERDAAAELARRADEQREQDAADREAQREAEAESSKAEIREAANFDQSDQLIIGQLQGAQQEFDRRLGQYNQALSVARQSPDKLTRADVQALEAEAAFLQSAQAGLQHAAAVA